MRGHATAAVLAQLALSASAAPSADVIDKLPGWEAPLPSKQYSGFLDVSAAHHLHYVYVEAEKDAKSAPVVLWLNGGPGASSFGYGYLTELGPFYVEDDNATVRQLRLFEQAMHGGLPKLVRNPNAWTTVANVLFLETPSNVGFSYCGTSAKVAPCSWTDTSTAALNLAAVQAFYAKFPELKTNAFYIFGESYAGIYIPMLADAILNASSTSASAAGSAAIPLAGIGVGNGCLGDEVGTCSPHGTRIEVEFLYGHGAMSQPTYEMLKVQCPDFSNPEPMCNEWLDKMNAEVGPYYGYNLYDDCGPNGQMGGHPHKTWREHQADKANQGRGSSGSHELGAAPPTRYGYPCGKQHGATSWLNDPAVRKALHVPSETFYGYKFVLDQIEPPFNYTRNVATLVPTYLRLIPKIKTLVYNGDVDPCVPYNGNEEWTRGLGLKESEPWAPWHSDPGTGSQIAGYKTVYEHNFTFATVKGAGHMVPQYQPQRALDLFSRWVGVAEEPDAPTATVADGASKAEQPPSPPTATAPPVGRNPIGADRAADEVKSLPGWEGPLPSKHYSGYLDVGLKTGAPKDVHIHYWLSESERSPSTDPVVFWMNGGPGGSSLIGGLMENGPFYMDDSSFMTQGYNETGVPTLMTRPERWNKIASTVYVETPAMTGFSYCDHDCEWNDETTADAHYQMTLAFFDAFPDFKDRDVYFTGESYAGLYIPMLADRILNNTAETKAHGVNLAGFFIGNGCPGWDVLTCTPYSCGGLDKHGQPNGYRGPCLGGGTEVAVDFRYGHALASQPTYSNYVAECKGGHGGNPVSGDDPSPGCIDAVNKFTDETGTGGLAGSAYNIYDMCGSDGVQDPDAVRADGAKGVYATLNDHTPKPLESIWERQDKVEGRAKSGDHWKGYGGLNNFPCGESAGSLAWLNVPAVQKALHVTAAHRKDGKWAPSSSLNYTHTAPTLLHMYPRLIAKLRILLFSGDVDECVPYNGAEQWTRGFGYEEAEHWHPWMVDGQVGGYATIYDTPKNFTWATVRGAGHMAPLFQPLRVYNLFSRFLHGEAP